MVEWQIIMSAAAKHLTPVVLELGGKSPVIVDSNIDLKALLPMESGHATMGKLALLLITLLPRKLWLKLIGGIPRERSYGIKKKYQRVVNSNHFARLTKFLDEDKVSDKIVYGGQRDEKNACRQLEESFALILSKDKPLAAYLFTKDKKLEQKFVSTISSGGMIVNDTVIHLTAHTLPFGGVGESGVGAYHGKFSFDAFSHKKAVMYRGFVGDAPIRYPPFTPRKQRLLTALLNGDIFGAIFSLIGWSKTCSRISASLSFEQVGIMADEENKNKKFDSESASVLVKELRKSFGSGVTKSYEWRVAQINSIIKMMDENESEIAEALAKDLSKPKFESLSPRSKTEITTFPSSAEIVSEPLGAVLVISTWNYPILLSLDPIIGAVAAGNAVVLKPSEIAPKGHLHYLQDS
ncbi:hypothetical protein IFM89_021429 [Coptis chinensis]|uniref:Aldehyde dehydrogenase domain-containing protein n=1 Tax=Coptis chinensis TaxID=261450 RepID=A0A835I428_9MAGN|nr:hypothetical protein IFM89_021429 [Coptis chinensis]